MSLGFDSVRSDKLITLNLIKEIQAALEGNNAGFRKQQGTGLVNQTTKEIVYMPPQNPADIENICLIWKDLSTTRHNLITIPW